MLSDVRVGKPSFDDVLSLDASQQVQRKFCIKPELATVVSLFSGCGGMDLGLSGGFRFLGKWYKPLTFDIVWANDINEFACRTYKHNLGKEIVCGDIWDLMDTMPKYADVVVGGFPCQDISVNGKRAGVDGSRSGLYKAMVEAVKRLEPKIFVAENVKGLLMQNNKASFVSEVVDRLNQTIKMALSDIWWKL